VDHVAPVTEPWPDRATVIADLMDAANNADLFTSLLAIRALALIRVQIAETAELRDTVAALQHLKGVYA
jgi:hypothetical protein